MNNTVPSFGRRQFLKILGAGAAALSATAMGLSTAAAQVPAAVRPYKLLRAKETRNNCTYCSVGCGILMYSMGDGSKNAKPRIFHVEGDPDHPVSRGSLCPKGAGLLDMIHSKNRLLHPEYRAPGSKEWAQYSPELSPWDGPAAKKDRERHSTISVKICSPRRKAAQNSSKMSTSRISLGTLVRRGSIYGIKRVS